MARKSTDASQKRNLTFSNVFQEMQTFYIKELKPMKPPTVAVMLKLMIASGGYMFSGTWATGKCRNPHQAQALWMTMHFPDDASNDDIAAIIFRKPAEVDLVYGNKSLADILHEAEQDRLAFEDDSEHEGEFWVDTSKRELR